MAGHFAGCKFVSSRSPLVIFRRLRLRGFGRFTRGSLTRHKRMRLLPLFPEGFRAGSAPHGSGFADVAKEGVVVEDRLLRIVFGGLNDPLHGTSDRLLGGMEFLRGD